jgi:hypothetical protein
MAKVRILSFYCKGYELSPIVRLIRNQKTYVRNPFSSLRWPVSRRRIFSDQTPAAGPTSDLWHHRNCRDLLRWSTLPMDSQILLFIETA